MNRVFKFPITVTTADIDDLQHVNNEVYLRWLVNAAIANSAFLGYNLEKFLNLGGAFVVRRHELDYLAPSFLGDALEVHTWISSFEGPRVHREYEIFRPTDNKSIMRAKTIWVFIDLKSGRPVNVPEIIVNDFTPFLKA